ncbi:MAG: alpha/beta fold hydrolase, partial [Geminicoccaceae bacterium]
MKALTTNGVVLHVDDRGPVDRPTLVFSNSLGSDLRVWQPLLPYLAQELRIIRYDKRGHGLSASSGSPFSIDDLANDLAGLLDQLGVRDAVIVGLSVGGMIAQALAARRRDLVRGLVLCDTAHKIGPPEVWETRIQAISQGGIAAISEAILERWFSADFRAA